MCNFEFLFSNSKHKMSYGILFAVIWVVIITIELFTRLKTKEVPGVPQNDNSETPPVVSDSKSETASQAPIVDSVSPNLETQKPTQQVKQEEQEKEKQEKQEEKQEEMSTILVDVVIDGHVYTLLLKDGPSWGFLREKVSTSSEAAKRVEELVGLKCNATSRLSNGNFSVCVIYNGDTHAKVLDVCEKKLNSKFGGVTLVPTLSLKAVFKSLKDVSPETIGLAIMRTALTFDTKKNESHRRSLTMMLGDGGVCHIEDDVREDFAKE